jgi:hypothetical protein
VVAGLNPSEDYKTSVLSGLSPTTIMECASRGLAFHSYQTSQEIIYQEHLAKGLTEKYNTLSQQMDQLIHDANAQIKALQDKMQCAFSLGWDEKPQRWLWVALQAEYGSLEAKNHELGDAFKEKSKSQQHIQKLYQSLKAQVMASHVATAAGDEAEMTLQSARRDRFIDQLPGTRTGTANYSQMGPSQHIGGGRLHGRADSRSSGSSGQQQRGGVGIGPAYASHLQGRGLGGRMGTGRESFPWFLPQVRGMISNFKKSLLLSARLLRATAAACQNSVAHARTYSSTQSPLLRTKHRRRCDSRLVGVWVAVGAALGSALESPREDWDLCADEQRWCGGSIGYVVWGKSCRKQSQNGVSLGGKIWSGRNL